LIVEVSARGGLKQNARSALQVQPLHDLHVAINAEHVNAWIIWQAQPDRYGGDDQNHHKPEAIPSH